jgi:uncharacterized repeat protein (TIGR03803 family)
MRLRVSPSSVLPTLAFLAVSWMSAGSVWAAPKYRVLHAFTAGLDGGGLYGGLVLDQSGKIYGVTSGGGDYGSGTVFQLSLSPDLRWAESVLYSFCPDYPYCVNDGAGPTGSLIFDAVGNLYGTAFGAQNNTGTTFELTPDADSPSVWSFQLIYRTGSNGIVMDGVGNLFGTWGPGEYKAGNVFELSPGPDGWSETVLYSFNPNGGDGFLPQAALILDARGDLYGTTKIGGANGYGIVFELKSTPGGWKERILHSFPAFEGDGKEFNAGLVMDNAGNLYGATEAGGRKSQPSCPDGCGMVFELTPRPGGGWKETVLHASSDIRDGATFMGTLVFDQAGNLYGTTAGGGNTQVCGFQGCGTVFKMTPGQDGKWQYTILHKFTGPDGYSPQAGVVLDKQGNIYGTTVGGGAGGYGVVFEIKP